MLEFNSEIHCKLPHKINMQLLHKNMDRFIWQCNYTLQNEPESTEKVLGLVKSAHDMIKKIID